MPIMEVIAQTALDAATLFDPIETQSVLTAEERELVAARLRAVAMQLDRGKWDLAEVGLLDLVNTLLSDACTTLSDEYDARNVGLAKLGLETEVRTYIEECGVDTLYDLQCVGDEWLLARRGLSAGQLRKIRASQRRWFAALPERRRLARLKLRGTKFASRYKTP